MNVEVRKAALEEKIVLRHLLELYEYDFSELEDRDLDPHGLFGYPWLDHYWTEAGRYPFLVRVEGKLAGFVLVRTLEESELGHTYSVAEFFILRKYRRSGVGSQVAGHIFDMFPGPWSVAQTQSNHAAQAFWRKVISEYTRGNYQERWSNDEEWKGPIQKFGTGSHPLGDA